MKRNCRATDICVGQAIPVDGAARGLPSVQVVRANPEFRRIQLPRRAPFALALLLHQPAALLFTQAPQIGFRRGFF